MLDILKKVIVILIIMRKNIKYLFYENGDNTEKHGTLFSKNSYIVAIKFERLKIDEGNQQSDVIRL